MWLNLIPLNFGLFFKKMWIMWIISFVEMIKKKDCLDISFLVTHHPDLPLGKLFSTILNPCMVKNLLSQNGSDLFQYTRPLPRNKLSIWLSGLDSRVLLYEWTRYSEETPSLGLVRVMDHTWPYWMINTSLTSVPGTQLELNTYVNVKDRKQDLVVQCENMRNQSRRYSIHLVWD